MITQSTRKLVIWACLILCPVICFSQDVRLAGVKQPVYTFRDVSVSQSGKLVAATLYDYYAIADVAIFETTGGKEVQRLRGKEKTRAVYFLDDRTIVRVNEKNVEVIDIAKDSVIATQEGSRAIFHQAFATGKNILAISTYDAISILDCNDGKASLKAIIRAEHVDDISISPEGDYVAARIKDSLFLWNTSTQALTAQINVPDLVGFGLSTQTFTVLINSPFSYQRYNYDGSKNGVMRTMPLITPPYRPLITWFENGFTFNTYKKTVITYPTGYQEVISTDLTLHRAFADWKTGLVYTWNNQKIEISDMEGAVFTRIMAQQLGSVNLYPDLDSEDKLHMINGSEISVLNNEKVFKKIPLDGKSISTISFTGHLTTIQLDNKNIVVYDPGKQTVIGQFPHPSIPSQYVTKDDNLLFFLDRIENAVYTYNISRKIKKRIYTQDDIITSVDIRNNSLFAGDEKGNIREIDLSNAANPKVLQNVNIFRDAITAIKILKTGVLVASFGRFLSLDADFSNTSKQQVYIGHSGFIHTLDANKTEDILYTTSTDRHIRLWDRLKATAITDYDLDSVTATNILKPEDATFFFTGNDIVFGGVMDTLLMKKWRNIEEKIVLQSPNSESPLKLAINAQGDLLASVDANVIKIRDLRRGFLLNEINPGKVAVNGITFSADGKMLAVASGSAIHTYDPYTGKIIRKIDVSKTTRVGQWASGSPMLFGRSLHDVEAYQNAFVAINTHGWHEPLVFHKNSGLKLFELRFNRDDRFDNQLYDFKCTSNGEWFATYGSSYVKVFSNKDSLHLVHAFKRTRENVSIKGYTDFMSFSADGKYLGWVDIDAGKLKVKIIDLATGNVVKEHPGGLIVMAANGDYYYAITEETLARSNIASTEIQELEYSFYSFNKVGINNLVYNAAQNFVAASDVWGNIKVIDGRSGKSITELNRMDQYTYATRLSPDRKTMLLNNQWGLYSVDLNTLERTKLPGNNYPFSGTFSPDGEKVYFRDKDLIVSKLIASQKTDTVFQHDDLEKQFAGLGIASDGSHLIVNFDNYDVLIVNTTGKKEVFRFNRFGIKDSLGFITKDVVLKNGKYFLKGISLRSQGQNSILTYALMSMDGQFKTQPLTEDIRFEMGNEETFTRKTFEADTKVFELSPSGRYLVYMKDLELYIVDNHTKAKIFNRDNSFIGTILKGIFDKSEKYFIIATDDGMIEVYDLTKPTAAATKEYSGLERLASFRGNDLGIESIQLAGNTLLVKGKNAFLSLYKIGNRSVSKNADMAFIRQTDQVYINNEGYYYASKDALNYVAYKRGNDFLSLDLTDLRYNRPDKVLRSVGSDDTLLINALYNAYLKRLKKNRIDSTWQPRFDDIPGTALLNNTAIPYDISQPSVDLKLSLNAVVGKLATINVWVNNVPMFGKKGTTLKQIPQMDTSISVPLSDGINKIEYAIKNSAGMESVRTPLFVRNTPVEPVTEKVYFIGIGIDKFADKQYNLAYSTKDIIDLTDKMKEKYKGRLVIDTLLNQNVTIEKIKALKKRLQQTSVNDKVIISYSGHGLLSKEFDYYLSTYSVNFSNPAENGLAYDELENLLDGIPARKKLLLIDACHSGEVDKEEGIAMDSAAAAIGLSKGITIKPSKNKQQVGLKNSFELMQNLFVNVGTSTGTTIISAAAGNQYALERGDLKNGVFTYCLIEAMDANKKMKVSELKKTVAERVVEITKGLQKPTSRNETLAVDWNIW